MRPVGSKYLLEETLGRGATGTVWRARVREDAVVPGSEPGQLVAIKVLREELAADPDVVMRFLRERSVLVRLSHPNIVRVRDLVVEGELLALVMDLVEGPDLFHYLRGNGPFSPIAGALLMAQIADALAASHADGVVHRDLKPANVLLATVRVDGAEQMHPMLTDFGIARLADSPGITRTHEFVGTPAYVAQESAGGRPQTSAVDVYGAGIMLFELVTGRPPFQGDGPLAILQAHLAQEPQRPSTMPEPLWTVIERCLRKDPAQRPSATSLARALRVVAAGIGVHASPAAVDQALAVGALLLPDPQPAPVTGGDVTVPGLPGAPAAPFLPPPVPAGGGDAPPRGGGRGGGAAAGAGAGRAARGGPRAG
ncbi:serine/threonine-protein kinase, partial [Kitasatospora indigofera]|uniref:serine/threonine-protein kinase n=1 Tax=Kitasatospora indigofera TaxID=67307 RepID=UPI0036507A70